MKRGASAVWKGGLKDGRGTFSTDSGAMKGMPYSFGTRFESAQGTNPEELIAAAEASCFSMAFSSELGKAGLTAERIETRANLEFQKTDAGWTVTSIHLNVTAKVPNGGHKEAEAAAEIARRTCPIGRLLDAKITMDLRLA